MAKVNTNRVAMVWEVLGAKVDIVDGHVLDNVSVVWGRDVVTS